MRGMDVRGVSPVIGVVLMVTITVILAAVIAAFVFSMSSDVHKRAIPAVSVKKVNDTHVALLLTDTGGASEIKNCKLNGVDLTETNDGWSIGEKIYAEVTGDVTVVCNVDGTNQVVVDTRV